MASILPSLLLDEGVLSGEGAIVFTKSDKTVGRIFLKQGHVYAVDNVEYEGNLWAELKFEDQITHGNLRALIRSHKSQRDSLYRLLKKTRSRLKNDTNMVITLQEYVLGAIDHMYAWDNVKVEWRMGDKFNYDCANVPEFPLSHMLTLCVNRSLYKFNKYAEWGFKNDYQFSFGNILVNDENDDFKPKSSLEEAIFLSKKFIIKGLVEATGYSFFTVISSLDDLKERLSVSIENPSGRQQPVGVPTVPFGVPVVKDKVHFAETDEDPEMQKVFNTEYHAPEPQMLLDTQETFNGEHTIVDDDPNDVRLKSFENIINDTTSLEVQVVLPPLPVERLQDMPSRMTISREDLIREEEAGIAELFNKAVAEDEKLKATTAPKAPNRTPSKPKLAPKTEPLPEAPSITKERTSDKPKQTEKESSETIENLNNVLATGDTDEELFTQKGIENMESSTLIDLIHRVEAELANRKESIDNFAVTIREKESLITQTKNSLQTMETELKQLVVEQDTAVSEYDKAHSVIETLKK